MLKIAIGADHGGFAYKEAIKKHLEGKYEIIDVGTYNEESCHYPEYANKAASLVANGECSFGILVCTTGEGISISANKVKGVRCGIGYNDEVTALMRKHNSANMIAFGQKFMDLEDVLRRVDIFLNTEFEEGGRHSTRVQMIIDQENK